MQLKQLSLTVLYSRQDKVQTILKRELNILSDEACRCDFVTDHAY